MRALYLPGPAFGDKNVAAYAGWHKILNYQLQALCEARYGVDTFVAQPEMIDKASSLSEICSYSILAAWEAHENAGHASIPLLDLIVAAPSFGFHTILLVQDSLYQRPKVVTYVWNQADWFRNKQLASEFKKFNMPYPTTKANDRMNQLALELSDCIIANSEHVKRTHAEIADGNKIHVARWGVDSKVFHPADEPPSGFRALFFGGNPVRKGLTYLLEALNLLKDPEIELWVLGCDPWGGVTQPRTRVFGMVPHAQVPEIIRQCHVLVLPTLEDGMPLAVQEAMASGVVPMTTECAADAFKDGAEGFVVPYRAPQAIAEKLSLLKRDSGLLQAMSALARRKAETQTWERFVSEFAAIIRAVQ